MDRGALQNITLKIVKIVDICVVFIRAMKS